MMQLMQVRGRLRNASAGVHRGRRETRSQDVCILDGSPADQISGHQHSAAALSAGRAHSGEAATNQVR